MTQLQTPAQTPKSCKSCGQEGHCRSSSRKCPHNRPQKKARVEEAEPACETAAEPDAEEEHAVVGEEPATEEPVEESTEPVEDPAAVTEMHDVVADEEECHVEEIVAETNDESADEPESDEGNDSDVESEGSLDADKTFVATEGEKGVSDDEAEPACETAAEPDAEEEHAVADRMNERSTRQLTPPPETEPSWKKNAPFLAQYLLRRDDPRAATHSSLVCGRYFVPPEMRPDFYQKYYAEVLSAKVPSLFLTERYNEEDFRFFVDIDYEFDKQNVPKHTDTIAKIQQIFVDLWDTYTAANYGDGLTIPSIELFPCRAASRTDWKLHVIFYKTVVDWQSCLDLGGHIQNRLNAGGEDPIKLDMKVYSKGSLRMLGSYKAFDTTPKHPNETEFAYTPIDIHTGEPLEWTDQTLEEYSIFLTPRQKECLEETRRENGLVTFENGIDFGTCKELRASTGPTRYTGSGLVSTGSPLYQCIKDNFGEILASAAGRIIHDSETNCSIVDCSKTTFCPLAGRYHSSNHPYIVLSEFGIRLKCYSTNEEVCIKGGDLIRRDALPSEVVQELPQPKQANLDISTLEGRARLLHQEFFDDGLRVFKDDDLHHLFILSFSGTDHDVAELVARTMGNHFVCVDVDKQIWYHYKQPLWRFKEAKNAVYNQVKSVLSAYDHAIKWYYEKFSGEEKVRAMRINTILSTKKKISDITFKNKVMKTLAHEYLDVRFEASLDQDRNLLGFNDGVYDIAARAFRQGDPTDHISMTVGYNFPQSSNPIYREKLTKLLDDMQPDAENLRYLKKHLASCLGVGNLYELFHVWSGTTRNGKSMLAQLLSVTLGSDGYKKEENEICRYPYACPYEPAFLTSEKTNASTPAPEIIASRLCRVLLGSEPPKNQKINSSFMKKLTGNDLIIARLLFSNEMVTFTPLFQLILLCNLIPLMDQNDAAVWKRARVINFPTTFTANPTLPHERQIDEGLKGRMVEDMNWRKEFMLMLLEWYYELFLVEGMNNPPASVMNSTVAYQEESIPLAEFWKTCISPSTGHFCLDDILTEYKKRQIEIDPKNENSLYQYKLKELQEDLAGLGVAVHKEVRCKACGKRGRKGVWNCQLSDARLAEIAEVERLDAEQRRDWQESANTTI